MRPANIVTAVSDVFAGIAISGFITGWPDIHQLQEIFFLCLATAGLYGGGVVFNDVFDAKLDSVERPERPIPGGVISIRQAAMLGALLLVAGIAFAFFTNPVSGFIAVMIAAAALIYDRYGKHHAFAGPLNMGLCRGLNLLLGISILPAVLGTWWFLAIVPVIYIASITMISRGEVHGSNRTILYAACLLYSLVTGFILYFSLTRGMVLMALIFLLPFAFMIFRPLITAITNPAGKNIGRAVKAGVLGLILMNASWAAAFGAWYLALVVVLLLPLSLWLGKLFAVT